MDEAATRAAQVLREAVARFTEHAAGDGGPPAEWDLLRALADYRAALASSQGADVLGWVPPVDELDELDDGKGRDVVMQVATWFLTVADPRRVMSEGRRRLAAPLPVEGIPDVVANLAEAEIDWPDVDAYEAMGLSVESAHFFTQELHPEG